MPPKGGIKSLTCIIFDPTDFGSILRNLDELGNVKFNSLTNVVKAADGTNVVEKVLKKPLTEKKTLSEGLMAKAVGNINSIINAVKTGENSAEAIQQAVNGIKAIDITETIKQVEIPKKNTVNEVLSKNVDLSERLTEEERRYYEALRRGSQAGLTQAELFGIGKVDEYLALIKVDYDEVLALRKGMSGGGTEVPKFNVDEVRPLLKTEANTAFFWSGNTDGVGGAEIAADIAKRKGGVTLETTIDANGITMPEWDFNNPSSMDAWDNASAAYAEQVSGEVRAVVGTELRPGNIWENVELPRLMDNLNVTKITIIDPKTGVETVIFER